MTGLRRMGLLLVGTLLSACSNTKESERTLPDLGRSYRLMARKDHDRGKPATVLFALHAYATSDDVLERHFHLSRNAVEQRGWILVVPRGLEDSSGQPFWNATAACCGAGPKKPDDVGYLHAVLEDVQQRWSVDPERVFALGVSNGGFMAHRWACEPGGDLRGIVSVSGAAPGTSDRRCEATVPVSVLQVHGDQDEIVRYAGGRMSAEHPSARDSALLWCGAGSCEPKTSPKRQRNREWFTRATTVELWQGPRSRVALWTVEGAGHQLPARAAAAGAMLDFLDGAGWVKP